MALDPSAEYPGQVISGDPEYPYGKARNITVQGDGTGTPWEQALVNDWFGFFQQILVSAGVTPSGNPDKVGSSQYLVSLLSLALTAVQNAAPLNLQNDVQIEGELRTPGGARFMGVSLFEGAASFSGLVNVSGTATFSAPVFLTSGAEITNLELHGIVLSDAPWGQSAELVLTGAGRIQQAPTYAADADTTYAITSTSQLVVKSTTLTDDRQYKLPTTGAAAGSQFEVRNYDSSNDVEIVNDDDVVLVMVPKAIVNPYVAFTVVPGVVRFKYEDDGLSLRWQATEIIDPAETF